MRTKLLRTVHLAALFLLLAPALTLGQWRKLPLYPNTFFNEVFFTDNNHGWITGHTGTVLRTVDGGNTWLTGLMPNATGSFNRDICFVSNTVGYVAGDDGIWKTVDGGVTWNSVTPAGAVLTGNAGCWFIDANTGVYGYGACNGTQVNFYRTTNGGTTWDLVTYTQAVDVAVGGITYMNGVFYATGGVGNLWKSTDNGATWSASSTGTGGFHEDIISIGTDIHLTSVDGSVCGITGSSKMARTNNGGISYQTTNFAGVVMWGVWFFSPSEGWCGGDMGRAYHTVNGGATWTEKSCGISKTDRIDDICFTDPTHGWAVGDGIYKYVGDYYEKRPDTIDFGDVIVNTASADSNARLTSVGSGLTVLNRTLVGTDVPHFQAPFGLGPQNIASCATGLTPVRFTPLSEGVKIVRLEYTLLGFPETPIVYLRGRGVRPKIAADSVLRFDTLLCVDNRLDTIYVRNVGTHALTLTGAGVFGPVNGIFQRMVPGAFPVIIRPGDSTPFIIMVTMPETGPLVGTLSITSNDPERSPLNIGLVAYRRNISAGLSEDTLVIPPAALGEASSGCIIYTNTGDGTQTIQDVTWSGGDNAITQAQLINAVKVDKNGTQQLCFNAMANDTNVHERIFRIRTQPCNVDSFLVVRYQAVNPIIASDTAFTLISAACDSIVYDTLLIENEGNARLVLDRPSFSGPDAAGFTIVDPAAWPDTIPVGGSRKVLVRYSFGSNAPSGSRSATITFPNNDRFPGKSAWQVDLTVAQGVSELTPDRRIIDLGDICLSDPPRIENVLLRNTGTAPVIVTAVAPGEASDAVELLAAPVDEAIAPAAEDTIQFSVRPDGAGPFRARYVVRYNPCDKGDTITVIGRGVGIDLVATPPAINYGGVQIAMKSEQTITLANNGNAPATIAAWTFNPPIANAEVIAPAPPVTIEPGTSIQVTVAITPPDTGAYALQLIGVASGPCADTLRAPIEAVGVKGSIIATRAQVNFGQIFSCDNSFSPDSLHLVNKGNAPINILRLRLARGSSSGYRIETTIISPSQALAPTDSLAIVLAIGGSQMGDIVDTLIIELDQPEQPVIRIPLTGRRELADVAVRDESGSAISVAEFTLLNACDPEAEREFRIVNTGTVADSVTIATTGRGFALVGDETIVLQPGADTVIRVRASMSAPGRETGMLMIRSMPCSLSRDVDLEAEYRRVALASDTALSFGGRAGTAPRDTFIVVRNVSSDPIQIDGASVPPPFSLLTQPPFTIGANDSIRLQLRYTPRGENDSARGVLLLHHQLPCPDSLPVALSASSEERFIVTLRGGQVRGRWGTRVAAPIAFENRRAAAIGSIDLAITASPFLLDPKDARIHSSSATGWTLTRTSYDHTTGTLNLRLTAGDGASPLPTTDTLILIDYEVLRGKEIASEMTITASGLAPNITAFTEPGDFALEDYCDAYGRLLQVQGNLALDQNKPNPFNPTTTIEFETPFQGYVLLVVYDGMGREVARLVDEELPAGRRRVVFDAHDLPSGVYTYKLNIGLQVLSRRMVVTK